MKFIHLSWDEIQRLTELLAKKINRGDFKPEIMVAVSRGGFPIARILCDQLEISKLASIQVEYYSSPGETKTKPEIVCPLNTDVKNKKILVVDDVADTGHSLAAVKKYLNEKKASEVKIATVHYKPWSVLKPDFFVKTVVEWIVYPWERKETMKKLISKLKSDGKNEREIKKLIVRWGFPKKF